MKFLFLFFRDIYEEALGKVGFDLSEGHLVWNSYLSFETDVLGRLENGSNEEEL